MTRFRPTVAEVDLGAVRHNVRLLMRSNVPVLAVVKADGYGHGDGPIARAALEAGATALGVALVEEGIGLRERGIEAPILVLAEFPPGSEKDGLAAGLTPTVYSEVGLAGLTDAAAAFGGHVRVHLKLDTGMHRVGLWPPEDAPAFAQRIVASGLELEGLWTHFADSEQDPSGTLAQLERFRASADLLEAVGLRPRTRHAANSGAAIRLPETHLDVLRPGAALYGLDPGAGIGPAFGLRPALTLRSAVALTKDLPAGERLSYGGRYRLDRPSVVATIPIGYDDGYPRTAVGAEVLIRGRRHPIAGTITMDQMLVDCAGSEVAAGDEVVLIGAQGRERITIEEVATRAGTIGREIATGIGTRVPREYVG